MRLRDCRPLLLIVCASLCYVNGQECRRPDGTQGSCLTIYECPSVLAQVVNGLTAEQTERLRRLSCTGNTGQFPWVCCDAPTTATTRPPPVTVRPTVGTGPSSGTSNNNFPGTDVCGAESLGNRIYGGTNAELYDFPWMGLLQFESDNNDQRRFGCSGTLINQRYIVTAAHCIVDARTAGLHVFNVRLGEYDISTERDCVLNDCADPVVDVPVEQITVHPQYDGQSRNKLHDIALIRLAHDVQYTDFIKPVCMPSVSGLVRTEPAKNLTASGWGRTLRAKTSAIKQKVDLPVVDQQTCVNRYASIKAAIQDSQLCAGGLYAVDTCDGDSGGPLMVMANRYWTIEGIVSFGYKCGLEGWPAIYTRVSHYEPWILDTMKA